MHHFSQIAPRVCTLVLFIKSVSTLDFFLSGCIDIKRGAVQGFVRARRKTENVAPAAAASFVKISKNSKKKHAQAKETL